MVLKPHKPKTAAQPAVEAPVTPYKDVEANLHDGAAVIVARHIIGLQAMGFVMSYEPSCRTDDVYNILSVTKAFTDVIVLSLIERGYLPDYSSGRY
jgi:CubicO group peptidase (beta-lactamase class C family)